MMQTPFSVPALPKNSPSPLNVSSSYKIEQALPSPAVQGQGTLRRRVPSLGNLTAASQISMIEPPTPGLGPTNPLNKIPTASSSLYHTCRTVLDRLADVDGFSFYLEMDKLPPIKPQTPGTPGTPGTPFSQEPPPTPGFASLGAADPTTKLWQICRFGSSLCSLYNALGMKQLEVKLESDPYDTSAQKKITYNFISACKNELGIQDEELFLLTDLYGTNTNGFVKVVRTLSIVLNQLELAGILQAKTNSKRDSDPSALKDTRDKVVQELLETERKHVHDMETLQNYQKELQTQGIIPVNSIHKLFANLNSLVDFQRRFLISLESMADLPPLEQRFGHLFITSEESFQVYEPFCANYREACKLVQQEMPNLMKVANILDPTYVLPSMLIKPVQRICKYPLLLQELIKSTKKDCPDYEFISELEGGLAAIKRVTDSVNETQRKQENAQTVEELKLRVEDWKGYTISSFGNLLLEDRFIMSSSSHDAERELHVFLFEKNLLICKEIKDGTKNKKSGNVKKKRASLQVRGRMFIKSIIQVKNESKNGLWSLRVTWKDAEMEWFSLKCRNEEQLKLWENTLTKLMHEDHTDRSGKPAPPKRSQVSNTQLASLANMQIANNFMDDQDDDDDDEDGDDNNDDDDDDEEDVPYNTRTSSMAASRLGANASSRPRAQTHTQEVHHRPGASPVPVRNTSTYSYQKKYGIPPRSASSSTTGTMSSMDYPSAYGYPHSPPSSNPSSPISSARISTSSSATSNSTRQRRSGGESSPLAETVQKFMLSPDSPGEDYHLYPGNAPYPSRSHSHNMIISGGGYNNGPGYGQNHLPMPVPRSRSQSSPNIHNPNGHRKQPSWDPDLAAIPSYHHHQQEKYIRGMSSNPQLASTVAAQNAALQMPPPGSPGTLTLRLTYFDSQYSIVVPNEIDYQELIMRVEKKIRLCNNVEGTLRIRYQDEDGDLIVIESDDDVAMALEGAEDGMVNFYVQ